MNVDTVHTPGGLAQSQQPVRAADKIETDRKARDSLLAESQEAVENPKIQPEELLEQIKTVTEDGLYSVRFEKDEQISDVVVQIFDNETQEVIRQIPAEEVLDFKASFADLIGNLVNTRG